MCGVIEANRLEARARIFHVATEKIPPEGEVFLNAQGRLQRVAMAEIMRLFGQGQLTLAAFQGDRSAGRREQARDQAKQRSLARSVRAGDGQNFAGGSLKIEVEKHLAAAAHTSEIASREPHFVP